MKNIEVYFGNLKNKVMKKKILILGAFIALILSNCNAGDPVKVKDGAGRIPDIIYLTDKTFREKIFDYEVNKEWKYEGTKPAVIDFYADWCAPCRQLSPIIEDLAKEYGDKIVVYKVDTEKETKLTQTLGISGLPTLLFIPAKGQPLIKMGLLPKADLVQTIDQIILTK
jgi:thioredoxin 1